MSNHWLQKVVAMVVKPLRATPALLGGGRLRPTRINPGREHNTRLDELGTFSGEIAHRAENPSVSVSAGKVP